MAARMKALKIERTSMRCPLCNRIVSIVTFPGHIQTICKGGKVYEEDKIPFSA